jgi:hypothetical protein
MGRFVNRDPISESGGLNLYGFVGNDAVNRWDYLGMTEVWLMDGGAGPGSPVDGAKLAQKWLDDRNKNSRFNQFVNNSWARLDAVSETNNGGLLSDFLNLVRPSATEGPTVSVSPFISPDSGYVVGNKGVTFHADGRTTTNDYSGLQVMSFVGPNNAGSQSVWAGAGAAALDSGGRYAGAVVEAFKFWKWPQAIADFAGGHLASAIYEPGEYFNPLSKTNVDYLKWQFGTAEGYGSLAGAGLVGAVAPQVPQMQLPTVTVSPTARLIIVTTADWLSDGTVVGKLPNPHTSPPPVPPPAMSLVIETKPAAGAGASGTGPRR